MSRQARLDQITDKENKEKEFEPITQRPGRVEKAVRQTDDDLIKTLELVPIKKQLSEWLQVPL
jgi:hypothetical protein